MDSLIWDAIWNPKNVIFFDSYEYKNIFSSSMTPVRLFSTGTT